MPTPTYTPLLSTVLVADTLFVDMPSIDQSYRDLVLIVQGKSTASSANIVLTANASSSNYSLVRMFGDGSAVSSSFGSDPYFYCGNFVSGALGQLQVQLNDYSATDKHKTALTRNDISTAYTYNTATRWASNSAITQLTLSMSTGNIASGTSIALFGIKS